MTDEGTTIRSRRERRSQAKVRELLLEAARRRFAAHGYTGVSVRAIAADAGASPQLVFNYFGTKAGLFEAAILEPFSDFIAEFNTRRPALAEDEDVYERTRAFVEGMFGLVQEYRQLLLAVIIEGAREAGVDNGAGASLSLAALIAPTVELGHLDRRHFVWEQYDLPTVTRATQAMIVSMVVLDNLWYEGPERPPQDFLIDQLTQLLVTGYRGPDQSSPKGRSNSVGGAD